MTPESTYVEEPADDPARHAWQALSIVGTPMELTFIQECNGDPSGFWRFRYFDREVGKMRIRVFRADAVASVSQQEVDDFRDAEKRLAEAEKRLLGQRRAI